jgi:hypothetical protein
MMKNFIHLSKQLREHLAPLRLSKKELRHEWISYWWSDQIAKVSW